MGSSAKGNHGAPYQPFLFFYDPAALAVVRAGRSPGPSPYAWIDLLGIYQVIHVFRVEPS